MNPVLILSHNTLALTKRCVESCLAQDCGDIVISLIDNDSKDSTWEWAKTIPNPRILTQFSPQIGVSAGWNVGLRNLFEDEDEEHVLVVNSDVILPPFFYRHLLAQHAAFVTGTSVGSMDEIATEPGAIMLTEAPDLSGFLISKEAWERIGPFDESLVHYCGDTDYHLRAWRQGIHLHRANVNFYHERSSTLRLASPRDRRLIELQADADRETFLRKWGFPTWSPEYAKAFSPETFGIDRSEVKEIQGA